MPTFLSYNCKKNVPLWPQCSKSKCSLRWCFVGRSLCLFSLQETPLGNKGIFARDQKGCWLLVFRALVLVPTDTAMLSVSRGAHKQTGPRSHRTSAKLKFSLFFCSFFFCCLKVAEGVDRLPWRPCFVPQVRADVHTGRGSWDKEGQE